jgi:exonuclease SbcC
LLQAAIDLVDGDACPVCNRDFSEGGRGSLRQHVQVEIERLSTDLRTALGVVAQQSRFSERMANEVRRLDVLLERRRIAQEAAMVRREVEVALPEVERSLIDLEPLSNQLFDAVARLQMARQWEHTVAERARQAAASTEAIQTAAKACQVVQGEKVGPILLGDAVVLALETQIKECEAQLQSTEAVAAAARKLIALVDDRERAEAERLRSARHLSILKTAIDEVVAMVDDAKRVRNVAGLVQADLLTERFSRPLSALWSEMFSRITRGEHFRPLLGAPRIQRGRVQLPIQGVTEGEAPFDFPEAVMSCGNVNAAALSLFLSVNLLQEPRMGVLLLDDPVQSMDDFHVMQLGALLRSLAYEVGRQLVIAVHERALFDYLALELGPTRPGDSLIAVEIARDLDRGRTVKVQRHEWRWDPVRLEGTSIGAR